MASRRTANVLGGFGVLVVAAAIWLDVLNHKANLGQQGVSRPAAW